MYSLRNIELSKQRLDNPSLSPYAYCAGITKVKLQQYITNVSLNNNNCCNFYFGLFRLVNCLAQLPEDKFEPIQISNRKNPVILVDPDGREIWITGDGASEAFNQLQKSVPTLKLEMKNGKVKHIGGEADNQHAQQLIDAIGNTKVIIEYDADSRNTEAGAYLGTTYSESDKTATVNYRGNPQEMRNHEMDFNAPEGSGMLHEMTEAWGIGQRSLKEERSLTGAEVSLTQRQSGAKTKADYVSEKKAKDYPIYDYYHSFYASPDPRDYNKQMIKQSKKNK